MAEGISAVSARFTLRQIKNRKAYRAPDFLSSRFNVSDSRGHADDLSYKVPTELRPVTSRGGDCMGAVGGAFQTRRRRAEDGWRTDSAGLSSVVSRLGYGGEVMGVG